MRNLRLSMVCVQTAGDSADEAHVLHSQAAEGTDRVLGDHPDVHA